MLFYMLTIVAYIFMATCIFRTTHQYELPARSNIPIIIVFWTISLITLTVSVGIPFGRNEILGSAIAHILVIGLGIGAVTSALFSNMKLVFGHVCAMGLVAGSLSISYKLLLPFLVEAMKHG